MSTATPTRWGGWVAYIHGHSTARRAAGVPRDRARHAHKAQSQNNEQLYQRVHRHARAAVCYQHVILRSCVTLGLCRCVGCTCQLHVPRLPSHEHACLHVCMQAVQELVLPPSASRGEQGPQPRLPPTAARRYAHWPLADGRRAPATLLCVWDSAREPESHTLGPTQQRHAQHAMSTGLLVPD